MVKMYSKEIYDEDYLLPYHWLIEDTSLQGVQYFGYLELFVNIISKTGVKKLLDVGCGDGKLSNELIKKGFEVTGIDFSQNAINHSKRLVSNASFICADVLKANTLLEFENYFDAVILVDVIEHIPPEFYLQLKKNIYKLLKKNGYLIFSVPSINYPLTNKQHYKHFSIKDIIQLFENSGLFSIDDIVGNHQLIFLKIANVYRFINNRYWDLKFIRKILALIYRRKFMVSSLNKACRYIVTARKV